MIFSTSISLAALSLFSMSAAQPLNSRDIAWADVTVETILDARGHVKQQTIPVPIGSLFTKEQANGLLDAVSTLKLTDATGIDKKSVFCVTYGTEDGSGPVGPEFTYFKPSYLSTNTVAIPSLRCSSGLN